MLERLSSSRLLASLQEVLVDRDKLTLGKELGRGDWLWGWGGGVTNNQLNVFVFTCALGEFGSVFEGVFFPDEDAEIKVAVKTMRGECVMTRTLTENSHFPFLTVLSMF